MAKKTKSLDISIIDEGGAFTAFFKKFTGETDAFDYEGIAALRHLLSNQKAKLIHFIKTKKPKSIYALSKLVQRDFKSVREDMKVLERFGLIDLISEKSGKRSRLKPVLAIEELNIRVKV